jgi:hypothetical protein
VTGDHDQAAALVKEVFGALLPEVEQGIAIATPVRCAPGVAQIQEISLRQARVQLAQDGEAAEARVVYADHLEVSPRDMSPQHSAERAAAASRPI